MTIRVGEAVKTKVLLWFGAGLALGMLLPGSVLYAGISTTKHNLSTSGTGPVKAIAEQRLCVFCHTPHHAISDADGVSVPLWNHSLSSASYQLYTSPTLLSPTSPAIKPDGSSRLCLSCHDGTVAIGSVVNTGTSLTSISMAGTGAGGVMPEGSSNMGSNLSGHHPVSIEVNDSLISDKSIQCENGAVVWRVCLPGAGSPVKLSRTNNKYGTHSTGLGVQCSSCHDAHEDREPGISKFLRIGDQDNLEPLCLSCHSDCDAGCP